MKEKELKNNLLNSFENLSNKFFETAIMKLYKNDQIRLEELNKSLALSQCNKNNTIKSNYNKTNYNSSNIEHKGYKCEQCNLNPIIGDRYQCEICKDYNLCENCEERIGGKHNHPFIKITYSLMLDKFNENYLKLNTYEPNK